MMRADKIIASLFYIFSAFVILVSTVPVLIASISAMMNGNDLSDSMYPGFRYAILAYGFAGALISLFIAWKIWPLKVLPKVFLLLMAAVLALTFFSTAFV